MTVFSFVLLLFLLSASIPLVVRTNVVALLIFLPIILRCFLLNVNNTFEDDDENDVGVGVDVAIQQKKSLEQTPPVMGPSGRGINRAHKKNVHKVTQFLSFSFSFSRRRKRRRGRRRPCDEYSFEMERFWFFPLQGKKTASRSNVTCALTFSQRARLRKKTMSSEEVVEENNALWRLFRNAGEFSGGVCRDVVEKHVLPRLNSNDVKFLYGVNTETRKLIKRSSRKGDLKKKFWIEEMSSISTLEVAWELIRGVCLERTTKHISAGKLLKRINSSYSSGRERRKSVSGIIRRLIRPHIKVIWKWYSIALQISVLWMGGRVHTLPKAVISRYSNTYTKKSKRLGVGELPFLRLKMVISTYSNIFLSVNMINIAKLRVYGQHSPAT